MTDHDEFRELADQVGVGRADQLAAAARDTEQAAGVINETMSGQPGDDVLDPAVVEKARTMVLSAMETGRWIWCVHVRRAPEQTTVIRPRLRRADCMSCARTWRNPPESELDRCDLCGSRGYEVTDFVSVRFALGNWLVLTQPCRSCYDMIGGVS